MFAAVPTPRPRNAREVAIVFLVFGITGTLTMRVVRPLVNDVLGVKGSMWDGPWAFRATYLAVTLPTYSALLLTTATLLGQKAFFKPVVARMWSRVLPRSAMDRLMRL